MTDIHDLFEDAVAAPPPSRLSAGRALRLASLRRRRRLAVTALAIGLLVLAAGVVLRPGPGKAPSLTSQVGDLVWAGRGDADHLYAIRSRCVIEPSADPSGSGGRSQAGCYRLFASMDGGAIWTSRGTVDYPQVTILAPLTLMRFDDGTRSSEISHDGGATWAAMPVDGPPIEAVPAGFVLLPYQSEVSVYDFAQGRIRPLAHRPDLVNPTWSMTAAPTAATLWVTGYDPASLRPTVAVSHDGGATWSPHALPDTRAANTEVAMHLYPLASGGGGAAYVSMYDGSVAQPAHKAAGLGDLGYGRLFRTIDGGQSWHELQPSTAVAPTHRSAWVTRDGRLVLGIPMPVGGRYQMVFAVSTDSQTFTVETPPGLSATIEDCDGAVAYDADTMYVSDDGWNWRDVSPH